MFTTNATPTQPMPSTWAEVRIGATFTKSVLLGFMFFELTFFTFFV